MTNVPETLTTPAIEQSTYVIEASFTDDAGEAVVPGSLTWTLMTKAGVVVNERENVSIAGATTITIVLSGDDLALVEGESKTRKVLVRGFYDSDLGTDLPILDEVTFQIVNLVGVL